MSYKVFSTIKELRKYKKVSSTQISQYIGISEKKYLDKENGLIPFSGEEKILLFRFFNMEKEDFFNIFFNEYNHNI